MAPAVHRTKKFEYVWITGIKQTNGEGCIPTTLVDEVQGRLYSLHWSYSQGISNFQYIQITMRRQLFVLNIWVSVIPGSMYAIWIDRGTKIFSETDNKIFRGLPFITTYIDDVLIHSINREMHKTLLQQVFQRIKGQASLLTSVV